jgi:hypothetical protein
MLDDDMKGYQSLRRNFSPGSFRGQPRSWMMAVSGLILIATLPGFFAGVRADASADSLMANADSSQFSTFPSLSPLRLSLAMAIG